MRRHDWLDRFRRGGSFQQFFDRNGVGGWMLDTHTLRKIKIYNTFVPKLKRKKL
jgi:hypothetical protein